MLNYATIFLNEFVHLTITVFPYFLIGVASGAFIEAYVKTDTLIKYLNKGLGSVVNASILGAVLPGCACATVPMAEGLKAREVIWVQWLLLLWHLHFWPHKH